MASGINFNPASRPLSGATNNRTQPTRNTEAVHPTDAFQPGSFHMEAQPTADGDPAEVEFKVSKEELTSAAFQQALATLASSGVQINITLVSAAEAQPNTTGAGDLGRPNQQDTQLKALQDRFGILAHTVKPGTPPPT